MPTQDLHRSSRGGATRPVVALGIGLGAFFDGIVFHQVLQWHHFVSGYRSAADLPGLEHNTLWDGLFHVASWLLLVAGLIGLWLQRSSAREMAPSGLAGLLLLGWGAFNVADEVVLHLILEAHHIRMGENYLVYDLVYTAAGCLLIGVGAVLVRRSRA